ncbi:MAG: 1-(5-phosphoribosyl)-5-((5-phosphoribosylamino)methylideneamino)imidazole-4-carboxamide isomerase, partial [Chloroflexi bacterium]|nr:1-(5-phosphoribosyl)-5-((5-phosphoribosylamino)methylideneamino)imidazole-4-carboxamide isomerase [Chloroflexota bacterium]
MRLEIFPALDLRGGKVVRLQQGDPQAQTTYSDDPAQVAQQWFAQGAR